jgi:predicted nucleic acid-binding protein
MHYIFDTSFVTALIIPDGKSAPHLFWYEITNVLKNLTRRGCFSIAEAMQFYPRLDAIGLAYDNTTGSDYSRKLLYLSNEFNLVSYAAAYLELAERKKAVLCTMDEKLRAAAKKSGVAVLK